ncbi:MAG TPA: hypothetical protein V6C72_15925 [Chroococcales cyanobacterium]
MNFQLSTTESIKKGTRRVALIGLSMSVLLSALAVGQLNIQACAQGASPDQDSLLPPEVVPLDPAAANQLANSEAQSRQAGLNPVNYGAPSAPEAPPETQSAQDFRKSAFNSLYGQGNIPVAQPQVNPNLQAMQGQMGQMPGQQPGTFQAPGQMAGFNPGLMAQNAGGMQTQTLSGSVATPQTQTKPSSVGKAYHAVSVATNLGGLGLMSAMMSRNPQSMFGLGLMGVGLLNYGMRGGKF